MRKGISVPVLLKGVMTPEEAQTAVSKGMQGIVVSNHQRRLVPHPESGIQALPAISQAIAGKASILVDGGFCRGSDVVKALCLGARAVLVGRAYAYGLGAAGGAGVTRAIEILREGIVRTLRLLGCHAVGALDASYVEVPAGWRKASG